MRSALGKHWFCYCFCKLMDQATGSIYKLAKSNASEMTVTCKITYSLHVCIHYNQWLF